MKGNEMHKHHHHHHDHDSSKTKRYYAAPIPVKFAWEPKQRKKAERNKECPCGSGKKFKKCCGYLSQFAKEIRERAEQLVSTTATQTQESDQ